MTNIFGRVGGVRGTDQKTLTDLFNLIQGMSSEGQILWYMEKWLHQIADDISYLVRGPARVNNQPEGYFDGLPAYLVNTVGGQHNFVNDYAKIGQSLTTTARLLNLLLVTQVGAEGEGSYVKAILELLQAGGGGGGDTSAELLAAVQTIRDELHTPTMPQTVKQLLGNISTNTLTARDSLAELVECMCDDDGPPSDGTRPPAPPPDDGSCDGYSGSLYLQVLGWQMIAAGTSNALQAPNAMSVPGDGLTSTVAADGVVWFKPVDVSIEVCFKWSGVLLNRDIKLFSTTQAQPPEDVRLTGTRQSLNGAAIESDSSAVRAVSNNRWFTIVIVPDAGGDDSTIVPADAWGRLPEGA